MTSPDNAGGEGSISCFPGVQSYVALDVFWVREREVCFGDYQKLISNGDRIGNMLEQLHHQNINFLILGRWMSNLLEMLLRPVALHLETPCMS